MPQTQALLFRYLRHNTGRPVSREELAAAVWRQPYRGTTRTIDQNVAMLRKKLHPADGKILTVWAVGYRFELPKKD